MKIITLQKNLKDSLFAVNHIAQKNTNLPILNNILFSAHDGIIKLISTNLEIGITSVVRGKIELEGDFTVDARLISEYVNLLDNDKVEIELLDAELQLRCGNYETKIKGLAAEEFPLIPVIERTEHLKINTEELKKALSRVLFSVSADESRLELSGVLFSCSSDELLIAGTDSYRLSEKKIKIESTFSSDRKLIVPAKTLQELVRIISNEKSGDDEAKDVFMYASDNQCLFVVGATELVSRLIDGQYPDYRQIIPVKHECSASMVRDEVVRAVKAASLFSRSGVNDIVFSLSTKGELSISSASGQAGEHNTKLAGIITGKDASITLNYRYVLDGLAAVSGASVIFEVIDDQTPCVIKDEADPGFVYIIMPIKK